MELLTSRLLLREFEPADWQAAHEFNVDPEVFRYLPSEPGSAAQTQEFVRWCIDQAQVEPRVYYDLAVVLTAEQKVIGWCRFAWRYDEIDQAEIAYMLDRRYWGQGFATEVARRLLQFGFETMGAHRIFMQREGYLRQHCWMKGTWHDSFLYAILDHEWKDSQQTSRSPD